MESNTLEYIEKEGRGASPEGILLADLGGNITYVNRVALSLFGYKSIGEILGRPVAGLGAEPFKDDLVHALDITIEKGNWSGRILMKTTCNIIHVLLVTSIIYKAGAFLKGDFATAEHVCKGYRFS